LRADKQIPKLEVVFILRGFEPFCFAESPARRDGT
jgi:hypothetical protein